jgi:hypothetical protein
MDRQVRLVSSALILSGLLVSTVVPRAKWLAGAVGGGLLYSALSNSCGMAAVLAKLTYNRGGPGFDVREALDALG